MEQSSFSSSSSWSDKSDHDQQNQVSDGPQQSNGMIPSFIQEAPQPKILDYYAATYQRQLTINEKSINKFIYQDESKRIRKEDELSVFLHNFLQIKSLKTDFFHLLIAQMGKLITAACERILAQMPEEEMKIYRIILADNNAQLQAERISADLVSKKGVTRSKFLQSFINDDFTLLKIFKLDVLSYFLRKNTENKVIYGAHINHVFILPKTLQRLFGFNRLQPQFHILRFEYLKDFVSYDYYAQFEDIINVVVMIELKYRLQHIGHKRMDPHKLADLKLRNKEKNEEKDSYLKFKYSQVSLLTQGKEIQRFRALKKAEIVQRLKAAARVEGQFEKKLALLKQKKIYGITLRSLSYFKQAIAQNNQRQLKNIEKFSIQDDFEKCQWLLAQKGGLVQTIQKVIGCKSQHMFQKKQDTYITSELTRLLSRRSDLYSKIVNFQQHVHNGYDGSQFIYIINFEYSYNDLKKYAQPQQEGQEQQAQQRQQSQFEQSQADDQDRYEYMRQRQPYQLMDSQQQFEEKKPSEPHSGRQPWQLPSKSISWPLRSKSLQPLQHQIFYQDQSERPQQHSFSGQLGQPPKPTRPRQQAVYHESPQQKDMEEEYEPISEESEQINEKKLKKEPKKEDSDLKCTLTLAFYQDKLCFKCITKQQWKQYEYFDIIKTIFRQYLKRKIKVSVVLHQFALKRRSFEWNSLFNLRKIFRYAFKSYVYITNSPKHFKMPLEIDFIVRGCLIRMANSLTQQNFHSTVQKLILKTINITISLPCSPFWMNIEWAFSHFRRLVKQMGAWRQKQHKRRPKIIEEKLKPYQRFLVDYMAKREEFGNIVAFIMKESDREGVIELLRYYNFSIFDVRQRFKDYFRLIQISNFDFDDIVKKNKGNKCASARLPFLRKAYLQERNHILELFPGTGQQIMEQCAKPDPEIKRRKKRKSKQLIDSPDERKKLNEKQNDKDKQNQNDKQNERGKQNEKEIEKQ